MSHVEGGGVPAGTQLNGIYEVDQRVAMGGMGEVYIGHVVQTGDKVAIKMILPEHANNELILDLFRKEASTLHNLYHEAIVRYYVFSVDPVLNRPYLAMEFAGGPALGDRIKEHPLSEAEMSVLLPRVAGGLHAAHKAGIIHRDMSPDNIILVDGDVNRAKIIDFGIAKSSSSEGTLIGSGFAGKLKYVSPEQLGLAGGEVTAQSDIYSLGLVFAEAVIGQPLDMGGSQVEVIEKRRTVPDLSGVPAWIRPLIEWMIQPDPADRPASMEEVANWTLGNHAQAGKAAAADRTIVSPGAGPAAKAAPSGGGRHPRDRRGQEQDGARKGGGLKLLGLLLTGTVAAAGVAAFVLMKEPSEDDKGSVADGTETLQPTADGGETTTAGEGASDGESSSGTELAAASGTTDNATAETTAPASGGETEPVASSGSEGLAPVPEGTGNGTAPETSDTGSTAADAETPVPAGGLRPIEPREPSTDAPTLSTPGTGDGSTPGLSAGETASATPGTPNQLALPGGGEVAASSSPSAPAIPVAEGGEPDLSEPAIKKTIPGAPAVGAGDSEVAVASGGGGLRPTESVPPTVPGSLGAGAGGAGLKPLTGPQTSDSAAPAEPAANVPSLSLPGGGATDSATPPVATTGDSAAPGRGEPLAAALPGGGDISSPSLSTTPVAADDGDPADKLAEPTVPTLSPGSLSAPSSGSEGSAVAAADSEDTGFALPRTGGAAPSRPEPVTPGGGTTELAAVAAPKNQPPTIRDKAPATLSADQGKPLNIRLGSFFDEDGAINLQLKIQGDVPNGLTIRMAEGGIAQIYGTPAEYGDYNIKVAAIDSQGLISESITVALSVERPLENRAVRDYILAYDGGDCFLSRPVELGPQLAKIEVFAAESEIPKVIAFDEHFKRDNGFEARIGMRPISPDQCALVGVLGQVGHQALDNSLVIRLVKDQLIAGDSLTGKIAGGEGARLFLFDNLAGITDLSRFIETRNGETGFSLPISGNGPQILIAARPRDGSGVAPDASLNQLLSAAQQGKASLALGFFTLK